MTKIRSITSFKAVMPVSSSTKLLCNRTALKRWISTRNRRNKKLPFLLVLVLFSSSSSSTTTSSSSSYCCCCCCCYNTAIISSIMLQVMYWSGDVMPLIYEFSADTRRHITIRDYLPGTDADITARLHSLELSTRLYNNVNPTIWKL